MSKELRMCFVSDSLLLGTNDDTYLGWPGLLCRREREAGHDVSLYKFGIRADTSEKIAARWRHECQVWPARNAGTVHRCGPRPAGVGGRMNNQRFGSALHQ